MSGVQYKLHGSAKYSVDSTHNQLSIEYTAPDGSTVTIPGGNTGTSSGSNP